MCGDIMRVVKRSRPYFQLEEKVWVDGDRPVARKPMLKKVGNGGCASGANGRHGGKALDKWGCNTVFQKPSRPEQKGPRNRTPKEWSGDRSDASCEVMI